MADSNHYKLGHKTWQEAEEELESADYVALPAGSFEQHSFHLPLLTDSIEAENLVNELAKRAPDHDLKILTLPPVSFGVSEHHMNFSGTITLTPSCYQNLIEEIGNSLGRHGVKRLLIINHHGGNSDSLNIVADRLQREHDLQTHVVVPPGLGFAKEKLNEKFGDDWGHAGDYETSMMEFFAPNLVAKNKKKPQQSEDPPETRPYKYFDEITEGGLGDPTNSDPKFIEDFLDEWIGGILDRLKSEL